MENDKQDHAEDSDKGVCIDRDISSAAVPKIRRVLSVTPSGKSAWVNTVKIVAQLEDGTMAEYFQKIAQGAFGEGMMTGAVASEHALYRFLPDLVPKPIAAGKSLDVPDTHFYLCDFVEMDDDVPEDRDWAIAVSDLHLKSIGRSPNRQFGFHCTTYLGNIPVNNSWNSSWESFWRQQMKGLFDQDDHVNGRDDELTALKTAFLHKVISRYLGPLERLGRSIEPCLLHSDLWPGNIKPKKSGGGLCMFDACAYWGHNEADLGICRSPRYKLGQPCIREYLKRVPVTEPAADFDGRNAVYAMKYHALLSIMHCSKDKSFRQTLRNELKEVIAKAAQSMPEEEAGNAIA